MLCWEEDNGNGLEHASWQPKPVKMLSELFNGYFITISPSGEATTRPLPSPVPKGWKSKQVFAYWQNSKEKNTVDHKFFNPGKPCGFFSKSGGSDIRHCYNTWTGLAFENSEENQEWVQLNPLSADMLKRIKYHLLFIICRQNKNIYRYMKRWLAFCLQKPGEQPEVVLVVSGDQGAGKSVFFKNYLRLFGRHSQTLSRQRDLFDRFGGTLLDEMVMLQVDEIDMSDKTKADQLKNLIGSHTRRREGKNQAITQTRMWANFVFTTNNRFCLPLESGPNRRFFHVHADNTKVGDKTYGKEFDEMFLKEKRLGLRVLFHWLSHVSLNPYVLDSEGKKTDQRAPWDSTPPVTDELRSQILFNATEVEGWWLGALSRGSHVSPPDMSDARSKINFDKFAPEWVLFPVSTDSLFQLYRAEVKAATIFQKHKFIQQFKYLLPETTHKFKEADISIHMPPLKKCRRLMNMRFPGYFPEDDAKGFFSKRRLEDFGRAAKRQKTDCEKKTRAEQKARGEKKTKITDSSVDKVINRLPKYFQIVKKKLSLSLSQEAENT